MAISILVIEDEKNQHITLERCLDECGVDIELAEDGDTGIKKLKDHAFDLVLLDLRISGLSGMQILEAIRGEGVETAAILTVHGSVENAVEAMKLGALDFISKPFAPEAVQEKVSQVVGRRTLSEQNLETYREFVEFAKRCILEKNYEKAEFYLKKAVADDVNAAEPHNLFGVIAEYQGDYATAGKHYRAACALDPTYAPADRNLQRLTEYDYTIQGISLGENKE